MASASAFNGSLDDRGSLLRTPMPNALRKGLLQTGMQVSKESRHPRIIEPSFERGHHAFSLEYHAPHL